MKKIVFALFVFLTACGPGEPTSENIHEILLEPENIQEFAYADFGPTIMTYMQLGKPTPFGGVKEKMDDGWPVGNIRVFVTAESYKEPYLIFLEKAGRLKPEYDYRVIWYYQAIPLIDEILADSEVPEKMKT